MFRLTTPAADDVAELSAFASRAFADTFAGMYRQADLDAFLDRVMSPSAFAAEIADPRKRLRLARDDAGQLCGYVKLGPCDLPLPDGEPPRDRIIELKQLYLADHCKGSGLADMLVDWAHDHARAIGCPAIYLSVWVENHRARGFYARHGYAEIGRNPFRVGDQIDDDRVWKKVL